jgi:hypothetical protein
MASVGGRIGLYVGMVALTLAAFSLIFSAFVYLELQGVNSLMRSLAVEVDLFIDYGNGTVKSSHLTLPAGSSALDAFMTAANVEVRWYSLGPYVTAIDGVTEDPEANLYWLWYIREDGWVLAPVGTGSYILKHGDVISFNYTSPEWW